ncbi:SH3 domain-containing protein (plasmid) [Citricoccus nitrophenolicus]
MKKLRTPTLLAAALALTVSLSGCGGTSVGSTIAPSAPTTESATVTAPTATDTPAAEKAPSSPEPSKTAAPAKAKPARPAPKATKKPAAKSTAPAYKVATINQTRHTTSALNVRSGPGVGYKAVSSLASGKKIVLDGQSGGWKRIAGTKGWVSGSYLAEGTPASQPKKQASANKAPSTSTQPKQATAAAPKSAGGSGVKAQVQSILAQYGCSGIPVLMDDPRLGSSNGAADWNNNTILFRTKTPSARVHYVATHECMHIRQSRAYGGNIPALQADMNRIYGGSGYSGLEQNADCMTRAVGITTYNYTSNCAGARGTAAKAVLSGKRAG